MNRDELAGLGGNRDRLKDRNNKARHSVHRNEIVCFTDSGCMKRVRSFEVGVNAVSGKSLRFSNGGKLNDGKQNTEFASASIDACMRCNGHQCPDASLKNANGAAGKGLGLAVLSIRNIGLAQEVLFQIGEGEVAALQSVLLLTYLLLFLLDHFFVDH